MKIRSFLKSKLKFVKIYNVEVGIFGIVVLEEYQGFWSRRL